MRPVFRQTGVYAIVVILRKTPCFIGLFVRNDEMVITSGAGRHRSLLLLHGDGDFLTWNRVLSAGGQKQPVGGIEKQPF